MWKKVEDHWIKRKGQDHYYRRKIVIPALIDFLQSYQPKIRTILDLGCGDGYTTHHLLEELNRISINIDSICLIEKSYLQLKKALTRSTLYSALFLQEDLLKNKWISENINCQSPKLYLSSFVFQEIPSLKLLFMYLSEVMNQFDLLLSIIPAPSYSEKIVSNSSRIYQTSNYNTILDWEWFGEYPVPINSKVIYLPHFQRNLSSIESSLNDNGLYLYSVKYLSIPSSKDAYNIFKSTIYGSDIIGIPSSLLLCIKKKEIKNYEEKDP